MKKLSSISGLVALLVLFNSSAHAAVGTVSTDRFGYDGTITRFGSKSDAENKTNSTDTITVGDRDLSVFVNDTYNVVMGSWWYTTDSQGRDGWGNTHGNTGVGYLQLYDSDSSTDTTLDMSFGGYDGSYWTEFSLLLEGESAGADDYARLSAYDNVNDGGIWHEYSLNLTAEGLEGVETSPGVIETINQPTDVTGSLTGIFEITENQTSPANQGFYTVDFSLNMDNWAWKNRDDLMTQDEDGKPISDTFAPSFFQAVPEPATTAIWSLLALAGIGLISWRRRRQASA